MKKILLTLTIFITSIFLIGCGGRTTYDTISYDKLMTMLKEKESFILFIGSDTCSHCTVYKKTLERVIKEYNVDVKYIDISELDKEQDEKLTSTINFTGTPTTVFILDGKENNETGVNRIKGAKSYSEVVEKFKKNGYIKEDN